MENTTAYPQVESLFDAAYQWLCRNRKKHPTSSDIWDLRRSWNKQSEGIMGEFTRGSYLFNY
jgi:hypothetical protein